MGTVRSSNESFRFGWKCIGKHTSRKHRRQPVDGFNLRTGRFDLHGETEQADRACVRLQQVIAYQSDDLRASNARCDFELSATVALVSLLRSLLTRVF